VLQVRELCETILAGRAKLEVIDIYQQPAMARRHQIVATPTLIMQLPVPVRRFIGNMTTLTHLFSDLEPAKQGGLHRGI
jgi:circadian clock protein KaiB